MPSQAPDPETRLFVRFRDDADIDALGQLYDLTAAELLRVALHLVRDPARAEDIVQQTFLAAIEAAPRFDASRRVRAWLVGILTNLAHKLQRQEARVPERAAVAAADPVHLAAAAEFTAQVDAAIDTLPEVYQPALVLHLKHGMAAAEIAHALRRPPGTVRTQLVRALEMLKKVLPASLAIALGVVCTPLRGLAAVKQVVMAGAAHQVAGATAVGAGAASTAVVSLGGTVLVKKYVVAVLLVIAALSARALWFANEPTPPVPPAAGNAVAAHAELPSGPPAPPAANADAAANAREAAPASPTYGSLRYRFLWESDRTPAVGVFVHCMVWGRNNPFRGEINVATDANGEIHVSGLEPGKVGLYVDRSEGATPEITPGNESTGTYLIPRGVAVDVTVQDEEARPIPGARVWLSHYGNGTKGHEVGITNGVGQLTIRDVGEARAVAARASGRAPSRAVGVTGKPGERKAITLTLSADGACLRGVVRADDGSACANASVWIGFLQVIDPETHRIATAPPFELCTDRDGRFVADGVPTGESTVRACAAGSGCARQTVHLARGDTTEIELRLPLGATVHGFVRDDDGHAVANARVFGGADYEYGDFGFCSTQSAANGTFALTELPPGRTKLSVNLETFLPRHEELQLAAGERRELDVVLQRSKVGDQIRGDVVDERGQPLVGWTVSIPPPSGGVGWSAWLKTDKDGGFVATGCTRPECNLEIYAANSKDYVHALVFVRGVKRGADPVRVVVPDAALAVASVRGRVVGADGQPIADANVGLHTPGVGRFQTLTTAADGTFRADDLPVRSYDVDVTAKGQPRIALAPMQLEPAKQFDLGTIVLPRGGRVTIEALGEARAGAKWLSATVQTPEGQYAAHVDLTENATSELLAPGRYVVLVNGDGLAATSRECEVKDGETTTVRCELSRGTRRSIEVRGSKANAWSTADVAATDAEGRRVWNLSGVTRRDSDPSSMSFGTCLGLGTWTVEAKTDSGLTARATVSITDLAEAREPIVLELH